MSEKQLELVISRMRPGNRETERNQGTERTAVGLLGVDEIRRKAWAGLRRRGRKAKTSQILATHTCGTNGSLFAKRPLSLPSPWACFFVIYFYFMLFIFILFLVAWGLRCGSRDLRCSMRALHWHGLLSSCGVWVFSL